MNPIKDHIETLSLLISKAVRSYLSENPSVTYTDAMRALFNTQWALTSAIDHWYLEVVRRVGSNVTEDIETIDIPDLLGIDEPFNGFWDSADLDDDFDEDDEDE